MTTSNRTSHSLLLKGGLLVGARPGAAPFYADIAIEDGRISAIGSQLPQEHDPAFRTIDVSNHWVLPGFIQSHVHLCQALFRGMADDLPLLAWLKERIWPFEAAHTPASMAVSAELGLAEMLLSGTTCILDMGTVHHQDVVFETALGMGVRTFSGKAMMDLGEDIPRGLQETTSDSLKESERLAARWHGAGDGLLHYAYAPRFILSCSEELLRGVAERSADSGALMHTHAAEHGEERDLVKSLFGKDDIQLLEEYGITGPRAVLAHGVQLTSAEIRHLAKVGTRVVHCPSANLKLGSGIAPISDMLAADLVVGLGADGAPCNNNLDALHELRLAALLAKVQASTTALGARQALSLLTSGGARLLGIEGQVGSLEVGKQADIVAIAADRLHTAPALDAESAVVYGSQSRDVRYVFVRGEPKVEKGELLGVDVPRLVARAKEEAQAAAKRAGLL